ncbi:hypothetical protein B9Z55_023876 [Caenorhabditis nigoni]|uniref:Uncharacterized protein n=1 Tax=Caenorhabditis nigoni TaxID=1611254 RepID=A0A2G5SSB8_9PELO|nr:hypothetical protein B9Z55_023876 [Caenorhabditis nigoni]
MSFSSFRQSPDMVDDIMEEVEDPDEDVVDAQKEVPVRNFPIRNYTNDPADLPMEAWRVMADGSYANVRTQAVFVNIPTVAEMGAARDDSNDFEYPQDSLSSEDNDNECEEN